MIDAEIGEVVEREKRAHRYQVERGEYLLIEDAALEALQIESTRTIEIDQFMSQAEVDPVYRNGSHYIAPDGRVAEEAFAVIREAMRRREVVGLGRVVLAARATHVTRAASPVVESGGRGSRWGCRRTTCPCSERLLPLIWAQTLHMNCVTKCSLLVFSSHEFDRVSSLADPAIPPEDIGTSCHIVQERQ
jgi:hypothetical protein